MRAFRGSYEVVFCHVSSQIISIKVMVLLSSFAFVFFDVLIPAWSRGQQLKYFSIFLANSLVTADSKRAKFKS